MNRLIELARYLPVNEAVQTVSIAPVRLHSNDRPQPLELRITAPVEGANLPVILFSHGDGPSLYLPSKDGYGPLVNFYAEHGFVVIQPTHANSKVAGYPHDLPGAPLFWRTRVEEMKLILDQLEEMEASLPLLKGRLDKESIAVVGHSMGGQTAAMLLGAHLTDSKRRDDVDVSVFEPRIKAGVLLAAPGNGGDSLSEFAREHFTELNPDYTLLITPTLSVVGSADVNPYMTVRGADWYTDAFHDAPGIQQMLTLQGAKHSLGGIPGYDARETGDDEKPDTLAAVQRLTWAYLMSALNPVDTAWQEAQEALKDRASALGQIDTK
ncbi:alpha/beta fold hydrolase [Natronospirillum operosum]|uniref:Alpha/beta fold hydrolase n=1 Tax=Natronospirillum operosum TaxID=2759953 RepID=A0A4Z0WB07_9GAMM|nr:alpha/beta fold hydrolase [Natronospirillum operosum]TGG91726.1 alpha/beta fold hydrolase [Natronospirillum operosum]